MPNQPAYYMKPLEIGKGDVNLSIEHNGDIVLRGKVIANDKELVEILMSIGGTLKKSFENIEKLTELSSQLTKSE